MTPQERDAVIATGARIGAEVVELTMSDTVSRTFPGLAARDTLDAREGAGSSARLAVALSHPARAKCPAMTDLQYWGSVFAAALRRYYGDVGAPYGGLHDE